MHTHARTHIHTYKCTHAHTHTQHAHKPGKPMRLRHDSSDTEDSPAPSKKHKPLSVTAEPLPTGPPRRSPLGGVFLGGILSNVPEIDIRPLSTQIRRGTQGSEKARYVSLLDWFIRVIFVVYRVTVCQPWIARRYQHVSVFRGLYFIRVVYL